MASVSLNLATVRKQFTMREAVEAAARHGFAGVAPWREMVAETGPAEAARIFQGCGVRVTGALFHTQGGLVVDSGARVLREDGSPLPNLFAGGGAARGLSGPSRWGYLSGNGLLTATVLGRLAGQSAAALVQGKTSNVAG